MLLITTDGVDLVIVCGNDYGELWSGDFTNECVKHFVNVNSKEKKSECDVISKCNDDDSSNNDNCDCVC